MPFVATPDNGPEENIQVKLHLPPSTHERLRRASHETGFTMSAIVDHLINRQLIIPSIDNIKDLSNGRRTA